MVIYQRIPTQWTYCGNNGSCLTQSAIVITRTVMSGWARNLVRRSIRTVETARTRDFDTSFGAIKPCFAPFRMDCTLRTIRAIRTREWHVRAVIRAKVSSWAWIAIFDESSACRVLVSAGWALLWLDDAFVAVMSNWARILRVICRSYRKILLLKRWP